MKIIRFLLLVALITVSFFNISAFGASYSESSNYFDFILTNDTIFTPSTHCGEFIDWDGDGVLDMAGFNFNISSGNLFDTWGIMINEGNNSDQNWSVLYDFSLSNSSFGGNCATFADLDNDGDYDVFTYDRVIEDTTVDSLYIDDPYKYQHRSFFENIGSNSAPDFVHNNKFGNLIKIVNSYLESGQYISLLPISNVYFDQTNINCNDCPAQLCTPDCTGYWSFTNQPHFYYQFIDIDYDNDFDIVISLGKNVGVTVWENKGTTSIPYFVDATSDLWFWNSDLGATCSPVGCGIIRHYSAYFVDIDSDGDYDSVGSFLGLTGVPQTYPYTLNTNGGWVDDSDRQQILGYYGVHYSGIFGRNEEAEPIFNGRVTRPLWVGDIDGDNDADLITWIDTDSYNFHLFTSTDYGDMTGFEYFVNDECVYPCIYDIDFDKYPDDFSINDLSEWSCDGDVIVENGNLLFNASTSSTSCCVLLPDDITLEGMIDFDVKVDGNLWFYASQNYADLAVFNKWDDDLTLYHYIGDFLGKHTLSSYTSTIFYNYNNIVNIPSKSYNLEYNNFSGDKDFYDSNDIINKIDSLCFDIESGSALLDNLNVAFVQSVNQINQTPEYKCFAGYCWEIEGSIADQRPSTYVSDKTAMGATFFFDYDKCIDEGYSPNMGCIPKLAWDNGTDWLGDFFTNNVVIIFVIMLFGILFVILFARSRGSGD